MMTANQFKNLNMAQIEDLATKTAVRVDYLQFRARPTRKNMRELNRKRKRLAVIESEIDRRHNEA